MRIKRIVLFGWLLLLLACHQEPTSLNTCRINDPLHQLGWLKDTLARYLGTVTVSQASYQGQTVFSVGSSVADAGSGAIYRCDGSRLCRYQISFGTVSGTCQPIIPCLTNSVIILAK